MKNAGSSNTNPSDVQGICPTGWHVPSFSEISQLSMKIGGTGRTANSGGKLKEMGTAHWKRGNTGATNEFGFNSIGTGYYHPASTTAPYFTGLKEEVMYWSSTNWWSHGRYDQSFYFRNHYNVGYQYHFSMMRTFGYSLRCVKDPISPAN